MSPPTTGCDRLLVWKVGVSAMGGSDALASCAKIHRKIMRYGIETVPSIADMKRYVSCLQLCDSLLSSARATGHFVNGPNTAAVASKPVVQSSATSSQAADGATSPSATSDDEKREATTLRTNLNAVRPFIVDAVREIVKCALNLIPESTKSNYAQCMRDIVTLGTRIARVLHEEKDEVLLDVLAFASKPGHSMYVGRRQADGSFARGSPQVRTAFLRELSLPALRHTLLENRWCGSFVASSALSILHQGCKEGHFPRGDATQLVSEFLTKLDALEATDFNLVNNEVYYEEMLGALFLISGAFN